MLKYNWFFRQKVTEAELDGAFEGVEQALLNLMLDCGLIGITSGAVVTENTGTPNLTVDISGPASIYDQLGQRISWTPTQDVDCSVDENSISTAVAAPGNEKWLSIFAEYVRVQSDPRLDGEGNTVQFVQSDSFVINVAQGAEAVIPTATRPALRGDQILLADVYLINGQTQILNADVFTNRRQWMFATSGISPEIGVGTAEEAIQELASRIDSANDASGVAYAGGPAWHDGTTNPATNVEAQLDKMLTELVDDAGADRLGGAVYDTTDRQLLFLSAGSIQDQLRQAIDQMEDVLELVHRKAVTNFQPVLDVAAANHIVHGVAIGVPSAGNQRLYVAATEQAGTLGQVSWANDLEDAWLTASFAGAVDECKGIIYSPSKGLWIAVGRVSAAGGASVETSVDGNATWVTRTPTGMTAAGDRANDVIESGGWVIVCGDNGKIIRSSNGTSYSAATTVPATAGSLRSLFRAGNTIWCVGENAGATGAIVLKSTDSGNTWTDVTPVSPPAIYRDVCYISQSGRVIIVGGDAGVLDIRYTDDGGSTWNNVTPSLARQLPAFGCFVGDAGHVVVTQQSQFLYTNDGGATWREGHWGVGDAAAPTSSRDHNCDFHAGRAWIFDNSTRAVWVGDLIGTAALVT